MFENSLQNFANPLLDYLCTKLSIIGEELFVCILLLVVFLFAGKRNSYKVGFLFYTSVLLNTALKDFFKIPRQFGQYGYRVLDKSSVGGYAFPSGHVQNITNYMMSLSLILKKKWIKVLLFLVVFMMSFSRIYVGAHNILDVLGAIILGSGISFLGILLYDRYPSIYRLALLFVGIFLYLIFPNRRIITAIGFIVSMIFCYFLEEKWLHFEEEQSNVVKILVCLFSIVLFLGIDKFVLSIYANNLYYFFLKGFVRPYSIFLIPSLICFFKKKLKEKKR